MLLIDYLRAGFALVPIAAGSKGPNTSGWNTRERCVTDESQLGRIKANVGLAHAYSRTCCVDVDDLERARPWLAEHGVDIDALLADPSAVRISSGRPNRGKLLYRLNAPLASKKLAGGALELRCATADGLTVQDVLPPSVHPTTGEAYAWEGADPLEPPELPASVAALWHSLLRPVQEAKPITKRGQPANLTALAKLLTQHDPDCGYDDWLRVGMALHHETDGSDDGLDLWAQWSAGSEKFPGADQLAVHWASFTSKPGGITGGWLAKGKPASADDFDVIDNAPAAAPGDTAIVAAPQWPTLTRDKAGKIDASVRNLSEALTSPDFCGYHIGYDNFRDEIMQAPNGSRALAPFTDSHYTTLRRNCEARGFGFVGRDLVRDAVAWVAERNRFDSATMHVEGLKHDGRPRVDTFLCAYFGADDTPYTRSVSRYLWTALAGRVLVPGTKADMVPILVGKQGTRKTTGVAAIAFTSDQFVEIDLSERDDNLARSMRGCLVGEIGELRGLSSRDMESVKSFITRTHEKWVPKYREFAAAYARRIVFIGTTNADEFLADETGNRRFLPVAVTQGDTAGITRDREQLWAEARDLFTVYGVEYAAAERLAPVEHGDYMLTDAWQPAVESWLADSDDLGAAASTREPRSARPFQLADVFVGALHFNIRDVSHAHAVRLGRILRGLGYQKRNVRTVGKQQKVWSRA